MARNFDDLLTKDRTFTIRGEKFNYQDVRPEILTAFELRPERKVSEQSTWDLFDQQVMVFLPAEQHERWKELRAREKDPVTICQLTELIKWLMEAQTGRPTEQPSPSVSGRGRSAA